MSGSATGGQPFNVNTAAAQGLQGAMAGTAMGMGYNSAANVGQYQNPFQQQVINNSMRDLGQARDMTMNNIGAQATAANAFGGSRHGLVESQANKDFMRQAGDMSANLNFQGYNQALGQSLADQQMRMGAANQMGNLSNLGFGMGQTLNQNLSQQGAMQQALQQMVMDRAGQQYAGYQQAPYQSLNAMTQAVGSAPAPVSQTSTESKKNGLMDYLGMGFYGASSLGLGKKG